MGLRYRDNDTVVLKHLDIGYLQFKLGYALFAVQICICLYTRKPDIMRLVNPLLDDVIIRLDNALLVTQEEMPCR